MNYKSLLWGIAVAAGISVCGCNPHDTTKITGTEMTAIEAIMTRTSVRHYTDQAISQDTIEIILRAAMAAPTAVNRQPWEFIVIESKESMRRLMSACPHAKMLDEASAAIVPCVNLSEVIDGETAERGFWIQDVSAATENLLIAAHALGIGAVWTGVYPDSTRVKAVQSQLNMPDSILPLAVVPMGYPAGEQQPKNKWNPAKVHHEAYSEN